MTDLDIISTLLSELEQLTATPACRLLVSSPPGWVVLRSYTPANRLLIEFASNTHLPEAHQLTEEQRDAYEQFLRSDLVARVLAGRANAFMALTSLQKVCNDDKERRPDCV